MAKLRLWMEPLTIQPFRNLWLATLFSTLGSQISSIGLVLFVFHGTHDPLMLAFLVSLQTLPGCFAAPFAGVIVDRWSKRKIMAGSDLVRFVLIILILSNPTPALVLWMTALQSIANMFFSPAKSASFPSILNTEDLPRANAWDQGVANVVLVLGPVIGVELFLQMGIRATLTVDAVSFLVSAALIAGMHFQENRALPDPPPWSLTSAGREIADGCRYLLRHRTILQLFGLFFVSLLCVGLWLPLAPFFIREFLRSPDRLLGTQTGVFGLGSIIGTITAPFWIARFGKGITMFVALISEGLALTLYSLVPNAAVSVCICLLWGVVVACIIVPYNSIIQEFVEQNYLGRIFAVARQSEGIALLLAMLCAIVLSRQLSSERIFMMAGILYSAIVGISIFTQGGRQLLRTN